MAGLAVAALLGAACGSDDDDGDDGDAAPQDESTTAPADGDGDGDGDGVSQEAQDIAAASTDLPGVDSIPVTEPLDGPVPEDVKLVWLSCAYPSCAPFGPAFAEATEALGWEYQEIDYDLANPAPGFQAALDADPDFIALVATPVSFIEEQLDAAKEAGIPVLQCTGSDLPTGAEGNGLYMNCGDPSTYLPYMTQMASWIAADSGGTANILHVVTHDLPVVLAQEDQMRVAMPDICPSCSYDTLVVPATDIGAGTIPQKVVSRLQTDDSIDYVQLAFSDMAPGVAEAIDSAGLADRVVLVGSAADSAMFQGIVDGVQRAWSNFPIEYEAWLMVDTAARLALDMEFDERERAVLPTFVVDTPEVAEGFVEDGYWDGPDGFREHFRELWGV